mmetsp:Transcript_7386/g.23164  ORF Transcript_7386/g.23164 Transcript_7386/m.23164 type:complete len:192 (+) Transcript_7386:85-660(+)
MAPGHTPENFSLGVTQILDELLTEHDREEEGPQSQPAAEAGAQAPALGAAAAASPDMDELAQTFQRTANLCGKTEAYLAFMGEDERVAKRAAMKKEIQAEGRLDFQETLGGTAESLGGALRANEQRVAQVRAGILEEMERRTGEPAESPHGEAAELDLAALLAECDAIEAVTSRWRADHDAAVACPAEAQN